ncbi:hypothetical protein B296_00014711 [Ensete ventricosum]|uniref:Uncharacterized protein n=1 Tax=Ensete ventricosum TaxID=4639 RepID=A0A427A4M5_ENSVE|nr:hypothetical protein B296_00014711 [Ensete ventricosum]
MEQHNLPLASVSVHVLDLYPWKAQCPCSMFHLLCQLSLYGLDTSQIRLSIYIELMVALVPTIP